MTCDLYRHFDANGRLLYVGIFVCAANRFVQHKQRSPWFRSIAWLQIDRCESRELAASMEKEVIAIEGPIYNGRFGRPKIDGDRPWQAEGISRRSWYRYGGRICDERHPKEQNHAQSTNQKPNENRNDDFERRNAGLLVQGADQTQSVQEMGRSADLSGSAGQVSVQPPRPLKRGRPTITAPRPWDSEGMSRRTWYRRRKANK